MRKCLFLAVCVALLTAPSALAIEQTFSMFMTGAQGVPSPGDPDGLGLGEITLNDITGQISWNFTYSDIASPTLMHIHGPNGSAGNSAGAFIGLGVSTSGGPGTLIDSLAHAPLSDISDILSDPSDFYVNIHNGDFPGGAVRGQLPEPSTLALLGVAVLAVLRRRRV